MASSSSPSLTLCLLPRLPLGHASSGVSSQLECVSIRHESAGSFSCYSYKMNPKEIQCKSNEKVRTHWGDTGIVKISSGLFWIESVKLILSSWQTELCWACHSPTPTPTPRHGFLFSPFPLLALSLFAHFPRCILHEWTKMFTPGVDCRFTGGRIMEHRQ